MSLTEEILILLPVLLVSISIHETMHALASFWLGDDLARRQGRVSLNPLQHIDPMLTVALPLLTLITTGQLLAIAKPVQVDFSRLKYDEFGGAIVGIVGPLSNLVLALTVAGVFRILQPTAGSLAYNILAIAGLLNITLLVLNMIPWPPLDGSRVLYAFAPEPLQEIMRAIERSGIVILIIFLILFYGAASNSLWRLITSLAVHLGLPVPVL